MLDRELPFEPGQPRSHFEAVRYYEDHARETLRQYAAIHGLKIDGWHHTMTRTPVNVAGMEYLAVSGTVIMRCVVTFYCLRYSVSLQPGRPVSLPVNFPTFKVRRLDAEKARNLSFAPERQRLEITPVC